MGSGLLGLTVMEMRARTVRVVVPSIAPDFAWMIVAPGPTPVANPEALIVATVGKSDIHMTELVRFRVVVPSLYVPVAMNCSVPPTAIVGFCGVTTIEVRLTTLSCVEPLMPPEVAWMVVVPAANPMADPDALIDATVELEEDHVADRVRSTLEPSLYTPVAVNC